MIKEGNEEKGGYWMLDAGCRILNAGGWKLEVGNFVCGLLFVV